MAPAIPGGDKSRRKLSGKGRCLVGIRIQRTNVSDTNSLRRRVVESEFRERAEMPNTKAFAGQCIDLAFILEAVSRAVSMGHILKTHPEKRAGREEGLMQGPQ